MKEEKLQWTPQKYKDYKNTMKNHMPTNWTSRTNG